MSFLSLATLALLLFTLYLLSKVHRLLKFQDIVLLLSVASLSLSLLCKPLYIFTTSLTGLLVYCVLSVVGNYLPDDHYLNTSNFIKEVDFSKIVFLFIALMFDLYKWCIFLIGTQRITETDTDDKSQKRLNLAKIILVTVQGGMAIVSFVLITLMMNCDNDTPEFKKLSKA